MSDRLPVASTPSGLSPDQIRTLLQLISLNDPLHLHFQSPLWTPALVLEAMRDELDAELGELQLLELLLLLGAIAPDPWQTLPAFERQRHESWLRQTMAQASGVWCVAESEVVVEHEPVSRGAGATRARTRATICAMGPQDRIAFGFFDRPLHARDRAAFLCRLQQLVDGPLAVIAPANADDYDQGRRLAPMELNDTLTLLRLPRETEASRPGLFRAEALAARHKRLEGQVLTVQPLSLRVLSALLTLALLLVLIFATTMRFSRTETAAGLILPVDGAVRLLAPADGTVASVAVASGQVVTRGQTLVTLRSDRRDGDGVPIDALVVAGLEQGLERIDTERAQLRQRQTLDREQREATLQQLQREALDVASQYDLQTERERLSAEKLQRQRGLVEIGAISRLQWEELQEQALAQRGQTLTLAREARKVQAERDQAHRRVSEFGSESAQQRAALEQRRAELGERLALARLALGSSVSATRPGRVAALMVKPGARVRAGQVLALIVDDAQPLEAELFLPSRAIGFIRPGQEVQIRLDAFAYQRYGLVRGHVRDVAGMAVAPADLGLPIELREAVYPVRVALQRQSLDTHGESRSLTAGMRLDADIVIDRPRLIEWVLEPLYTLRGR